MRPDKNRKAAWRSVNVRPKAKKGHITSPSAESPKSVTVRIEFIYKNSDYSREQ
jgi:hypothetical protein